MQWEFGYIVIQTARPQALAAGLTDWPIGPLSWIVDKFREWTFPHEALPEQVIGFDWLLTSIML